MYERKILPFYMTYPLPMYYQEEESIIRELVIDHTSLIIQPIQNPCDDLLVLFGFCRIHLL